MSCEAVTREAAKTLIICKDLQESKEEEIIKFLKYVKDHRVYFTAAHFFEINRKSLLSILNIMINYLIVILQLNRISLH